MAIFNTVPPLKAGAGIKFDGETISTGAAPRNLLDNSDFRNPVNQRGATSYTGTGARIYTIDRWFTWSSFITVSLQNGYLSIANSSDNDYQQLSQVITSHNLTNKAITIAVWDDNGGVYCSSGILANGRVITVYPDVVFWASANLSDDGNIIFNISPKAGQTCNIKAAALYEGEYTAETLPEYQPKGYAAELAECQRYFVKYQDVRLIPFVFDGTTLRHYRLIHDIPMRVEHPTIDASGLVERKVWGDIASQFNFYGSDKNGVTFSATSEVSDNASIYVAGTITFDAEA